MAYIRVQNAVVDRFIYNGKGAKVYEQFTKKDGTTGRSYFTAWFSQEIDEFNEGDIVNLSGTFSVKANQYTDKDGVDRVGVDASINNTKFDGFGDAPGDDEEL